MIEAITCLATTHDPWLVLLAGLMCGAGALSVMQLFRRAAADRGLAAFGWTLLCALTLGAAVWCTHFIAMLAHRPGVPVSFDAVLTIVSFLVPILGAIPGLLLAASASSGSRGAAEEAPLSHWRAVAGGAVVGAAIAAMHYTGMAAYRVEGIVVWNPSVIALSVALSMTISAAAFLLASTYAGQRVPRAAGGVFALAVLSLHFTGMAAVTTTPLGTAGTEAAVEAQHAMALAVALAGLIV